MLAIGLDIICYVRLRAGEGFAEGLRQTILKTLLIVALNSLEFPFLIKRCKKLTQIE